MKYKTCASITEKNPSKLNLILNKTFKGLLIEGNEKRFIALKKNLEKKMLF